MHPRGRRYGVKELKDRRDQVYNEQTSHLIPPISYVMKQGERILPDVGFWIQNLGDRYLVYRFVKTYS